MDKQKPCMFILEISKNKNRACSYFLIDLERFLLQNCFLFPNSGMIADLNPPSWLNAVYGLKTTRGNYEVAWD